MKIELDEKSIDNLVKYAKENPKEIRELLEVLADEFFDVLMTRKVLEKGAKLYKSINREINYSYKKEQSP